MPLNFPRTDDPNNPLPINYEHTENGKIYIWNGESWSNKLLGIVGFRGSAGAQGPVGFQGSAGVPGPGATITVPGSNTQIIFNNNGSLGAGSNFTHVTATGNTTIAGSEGRLRAGFIDNTPIGVRADGTTAAASRGAFTFLSASSQVSFNTTGSITIDSTGTGVTSISSGALGSINNMSIGQTTPAAGSFTSLNAIGAGNVVLTPTGTNTVTIKPNTTGSINNMSIGQDVNGARAGSFTALSANTLNANTITFTGGSINNVTIGLGLNGARDGRFTSIEITDNFGDSVKVYSDQPPGNVYTEDGVLLSASVVSYLGGVAAAKSILTVEDLIMVGVDSTIQLPRPWYEPPKPSDTVAHIYTGEYGGYNTTRRLLVTQKDDMGIVSNLQPFLGQKQIFNWFPTHASLWPTSTAPTTRISDSNAFFQVNQYAGSIISLPLPSSTVSGQTNETDSYLRSRRARYKISGSASSWAGQIAEANNCFLTLGNNGESAVDSGRSNPLGGFFYTCRFGFPKSENGAGVGQLDKRFGFFVGLGTSNLSTIAGVSSNYGVQYYSQTVSSDGIDLTSDTLTLATDHKFRASTNANNVRVRLTFSGTIGGLTNNTLYFLYFSTDNTKPQLYTNANPPVLVNITSKPSPAVQISITVEPETFDPLYALNHIGISARSEGDAAFLITCNGLETTKSQQAISLFQKQFSPLVAKKRFFNPQSTQVLNNNTFIISSHGFNTGDPIIYEVAGDSTTIRYNSGNNTTTPLYNAANNTYYVYKLSSSQFRIALTKEQATALNPTTGVPEPVTLEFSSTGTGTSHVFIGSGIDIDQNIFIIPDHEYNTSSPVIYSPYIIRQDQPTQASQFEVQEVQSGSTTRIKARQQNLAGTGWTDILGEERTPIFGNRVYYATRIDKHRLSLSNTVTRSITPQYTANFANLTNVDNSVDGQNYMISLPTKANPFPDGTAVFYTSTSNTTKIPSLTRGSISNGPAYYVKGFGDRRSTALTNNNRLALAASYDNLSIPSLAIDISTATRGGYVVFNPYQQVDPVTNEITIENHGFADNTPVRYSVGATISNVVPQPIANLSTNATYYVKVVDRRRIRLMTSPGANDPSPSYVDFVDQGVGTRHELIPFPTSSSGAQSAVNLETQTFTKMNHGLKDGTPLFYDSLQNSPITSYQSMSIGSTGFYSITPSSSNIENLTANLITLDGHTFTTGSAVKLYWVGTTPPITVSGDPLNKTSTYYVEVDNTYPNAIRLYRQRSNQGSSSITLSDVIIITGIPASPSALSIVGIGSMPRDVINNLGDVGDNWVPMWVKRLDDHRFTLCAKPSDVNVSGVQSNLPVTYTYIPNNSSNISLKNINLSENYLILNNHSFKSGDPVKLNWTSGSAPLIVAGEALNKTSTYYINIQQGQRPNFVSLSRTTNLNASAIDITGITSGTLSIIPVLDPVFTEESELSILGDGSFAVNFIPEDAMSVNSSTITIYNHGFEEGMPIRYIPPSVTLSFTGTTSVDIASDTITIINHQLKTGDGLIYTISTGGTVIAGLASGTTYYAIRIDDNTFKLATTAGNATASPAVAINLTSAGGSTTTNTFTRVDYSVRVNLSPSGTKPLHDTSFSLLYCKDVTPHTFRVCQDLGGAPFTIGLLGSGNRRQHTFVGHVNGSYMAHAGVFYYKNNGLRQGQILGYDTNGNFGFPFAWARSTGSHQDVPNTTYGLSGHKVGMTLCISKDGLTVGGTGYQITTNSADTYSTGGRIRFATHGLTTGQPVIYTCGVTTPVKVWIEGANTTEHFTLISGDYHLTDGRIYYAINTDANTFKLATTLENALSGTHIRFRASGGTGDQHSITTCGSSTNVMVGWATKDHFTLQLPYMWSGSTPVGDNSWASTGTSPGSYYPATGTSASRAYNSIQGYSSGVHKLVKWAFPASSSPDNFVRESGYPVSHYTLAQVTGGTNSLFRPNVAAIDPVSNCMVSPFHGFVHGDVVTHYTGDGISSGADITDNQLLDYERFENGQLLTISKRNDHCFSFAKNFEDVVLAVDIDIVGPGSTDAAVAATTASATLVSSFPIPSANVNTSTSRITLVNHGFNTGDILFYRPQSTLFANYIKVNGTYVQSSFIDPQISFENPTLIAQVKKTVRATTFSTTTQYPLTMFTPYYCKRIDKDTFSIALIVPQGNQIVAQDLTIVNAGGGNHTFVKSRSFNYLVKRSHRSLPLVSAGGIEVNATHRFSNAGTFINVRGGTNSNPDDSLNSFGIPIDLSNAGSVRSVNVAANTVNATSNTISVPNHGVADDTIATLIWSTASAPFTTAAQTFPLNSNPDSYRIKVVDSNTVQLVNNDFNRNIVDIASTTNTSFNINVLNQHTLSYGDFSVAALDNMFELSIYAPTYWPSLVLGENPLPMISFVLKNLTTGNTLAYDFTSGSYNNGTLIDAGLNLPDYKTAFLGHKAFVDMKSASTAPTVGIDVMSVYMESDFDIKHETFTSG